MRDDLNAIPVFVTVVESGNFASAAAILHVTRSAVGKTIARLEARLGVALFQRTTRRQLLTEEGEQFYLQCREALERIREAEETLQRGKDEVQGRLREGLDALDAYCAGFPAGTLTGAPKRNSVLRLPGSVSALGTIRDPSIMIPREVKSLGNVLKSVGRALKGKQGPEAADADCAALHSRTLGLQRRQSGD